MDNQPWWGKDVSEELTIVAVMCIAIAAMWILGGRAQELSLAAISGLIGYLAKGNSK